MRRRSRTRGRSVEAPLDHIADQMKAIRTARFSARLATKNGLGDTHLQGVWDFERHAGLLRTMAQGIAVDLLFAGPTIFHLLPPEDQRRTGKVWQRAGDRKPNWATERAETIASVRHLAHPVDVVLEEIAGESVHHHTLLIKPRPDEQDPLLAAVHEHARTQRIKRLTIEVWMTPDGRLRQTREHSILSAIDRTGVKEFIADAWDFGIETPDLAIPPPDQVLAEDTTPSSNGLTILIDGKESTY